MNEMQIKLTVLYNNQFWIGIFEKTFNGKLKVVKYTFGAEPKDTEIYDFILKQYNKLNFSNFINVEVKEKNVVNPKRMQRLAKKQIKEGIGTKSQQALKLQQEENKIIRRTYNKEMKEKIEKEKFQMKQIKKIEKRKGR